MMRPLELQRQFPRIQIFADVRQALFQLQQGVPDIFLVGKRDVAPHRVGTGRNARHLAQGAPSGFEQRSVFAIFIHQRRGQCGRDQLRQVADPGTELVMRIGVHAGYAGANLFHPLQKFSTQAFEYFLSRSRRNKPHRTLKQIRVGGFDS